jgi:hypothetical protein
LFGGVVGRLHAFVAEKGEELLEVLEKCKCEVAYIFIGAVHVTLRQREELLLQRDGFGDQLLACDGTISYAGSVAKTMP